MEEVVEKSMPIVAALVMAKVSKNDPFAVFATLLVSGIVAELLKK